MKKINMLKALIAAFLLVSMLQSCKKASTDRVNNTAASEYYIRFKANGISKVYTIPGVAVSGNPGIAHDSMTYNGNKIHYYTFSALNQDIQYMQFAVYSDSLLASGLEYKESRKLFGYQPKTVFIYNEDPAAYAYLSVGAFDPLNYLYVNIVRTCTVKVNEIAATYMKGTLSGTVYHEKTNGDPDFNDKVLITEGEFYLPVK